MFEVFTKRKVCSLVCDGAVWLVLWQVDVHVMTNPVSGEWVYFGTEITDGNGKASYTIPHDKKLPQGMYPVKMVVR